MADAGTQPPVSRHPAPQPAPAHRAPAGSAARGEGRFTHISALREVGRCLIGGGQECLQRINAVFDRCETSGLPNAVLATLHRRRAQIVPKRPVSFARLLFTPLDPLLLPAPQWRRDQLGIPRTAIRPMARLVQMELALPEDAVDAAPQDGQSGVRAAVPYAGPELWPGAAAILAVARPPPDWQHATGLRPADFENLARHCAAVLRRAVALDAMVASHGPRDSAGWKALRGCVPRSGRSDHLVEASVITVLLARLAPSGRLLAMSSELLAGPPDGAGRVAADHAIDFMLDALDGATFTTMELAETSAAVWRAAILLDAVEQPGPAQRPTRRARIEALRRSIAISCMARFDQELSDRVLAIAMLVTSDATTADIEGIEAGMRQLKQFEISCRRMGQADLCERMLRMAAGYVARLDAANRIDRARLVEIMAGSDVARELL